MSGMNVSGSMSIYGVRPHLNKISAAAFIGGILICTAIYLLAPLSTQGRVYLCFSIAKLLFVAAILNFMPTMILNKVVRRSQTGGWQAYGEKELKSLGWMGVVAFLFTILQMTILAFFFGWAVPTIWTIAAR